MEQVSYVFEEGENALALQRNATNSSVIHSSNRTDTMNQFSESSTETSPTSLGKTQSKTFVDILTIFLL